MIGKNRFFLFSIVNLYFVSLIYVVHLSNETKLRLFHFQVYFKEMFWTQKNTRCISILMISRRDLCFRHLIKKKKRVRAKKKRMPAQKHVFTPYCENEYKTSLKMVEKMLEILLIHYAIWST